MSVVRALHRWLGMSAFFRAAAVAREVRTALRLVRSLPSRLADNQRELEFEQPKTRQKPLFLDSALQAARSMRAPVVTG